MEINRSCPESRFDNFTDWFFFTHIDPILRIWHSLGMIGGVLLFALAAILWNIWSIPVFVLGVVFFYGFGLISHALYAGGSGKTTPDRYHNSIGITIKINLSTATGTYRRHLETFLEKYPFVARELDLRVVDAKGPIEAMRFLFGERNVALAAGDPIPIQEQE